MKRTKVAMMRLFDDITAYVKAKRKKFGLSNTDAEDLVTDAYLLARERLRKAKVHSSRDAAIKTMAWRCVISTLRKIEKEESVLKDAISIDAENSVERPGGEAESYHMEVFDSNQPTAPDVLSSPDLPDWEEMTKEQVDKEHGDARKVVTRLKKPYMSYAKAMRETKLSRCFFSKTMKKLRNDFDQCFQAYHECLAAEFDARYQISRVNTSGEAK